MSNKTKLFKQYNYRNKIFLVYLKIFYDSEFSLIEIKHFNDANQDFRIKRKVKRNELINFVKGSIHDEFDKIINEMLSDVLLKLKEIGFEKIDLKGEEI